MDFNMFAGEGVEIGKVYDIPQQDISRHFVTEERRNALALPRDQQSERQKTLAALTESEIDAAAKMACKNWPQTYYCKAKLSYQLTPVDDGGADQQWSLIMNFAAESQKVPIKLRMSFQVDHHFCIGKGSIQNETPTQPDSNDMLSGELRLE